MRTYDRNVAIASSSVYGAVLCCGLLCFLVGIRREPFYKHPSASVAVFSVFWFSLAPSVLFLGATIPWLGAAYGSTAAALVFAIVPGCLFVLLGALWLLLYDADGRASRLAAVPRLTPWVPSAAGLDRSATAAQFYRHPGGIEGHMCREELAGAADIAAFGPQYSSWPPGVGRPGFDQVFAAPVPVRTSQGYRLGRELDMAEYTHEPERGRVAPAFPSRTIASHLPPQEGPGRSLGTHYLA
ncbi:hypothetical protein NESM_000049700 [Novymonas esmeraldas]|uniref:Uncharacterized protein n=1 Tax=Novymonas esmeraldas TaxID=1808958 RepID=A0AAW0F1N4_9TRYP